ncbi:histidine kinase [Hymenobacter sp. BT635]|uniref:Histidine kinase n=1 Tax=Hymenobacter nitidus TaxID=2880929 RepID=A0ABS8AC29_9BACT|nr:histidine kinase [Hymenobacter nitidus]MCB2376790.1 histidine kinase [Hymenobacter nitidus]
METTFSGGRLPVLAPALRRVLVPVFWWGLFVLAEFVAFSNWQETALVTWGFVLKDLVATMLGYYFFSRVVLPRWLLRRRWLRTALGLLAIYYAWGLLSYAYYALLDRYGLISANAHDYMHRLIDYGLWGGVFSWRAVSMGISDFSVTTLPPILVRFVRFLLTSSNQSLRLQRENLTLEVSFLKAQVNPHFLFNTLNNIYTMVVRQDERAPTMVQHLTDLMHYTVYESDAALVPLSREIGFLEDYLELERLRYGPKVSIRYHQAGPVADFRITPLLFFPFVENAFKHGVDSSLEASWVTIGLEVKDGQLHFEVSNSLTPSGPPREFGGVGVANVQKRLALHYPPEDYQLTIGPEPENTYRAALTLRLHPA